MPGQPAHPERDANPVVRRYRDAYRAASLIVAIGGVFKFIGVALGLLIALFSLGSANDNPFGEGGALVGGLLVGAVVGGFFFLCGVFVAAQGQLLQATLDTAVSSSPFLTNKQRAQAMGLPRSAVKKVST